MTIVEFPDGRIVEFPTGTPEPVIKQMVADFIFPPPAPAPSLPAADDVMPEAEVFLEPDVLEPEEPAALLEPAPPSRPSRRPPCCRSSPGSVSRLIPMTRTCWERCRQ